jgi:putative PIN family toxin of toxin-antitoxin system
VTDPAPRRVVLDPNVLVSAAISPGRTTARILDLIDSGLLVPIVSPALIAELSGVLARPRFRRYLDLNAVSAFTDELERLGEWHRDVADPPRLSSDPDDDYLLALAAEAEADALVSGDPDLSALTVEGTRILTPRALLDLTDSDA